MNAHPAAGSSRGNGGSGGQQGNTAVTFAVALHQSDWEPEFFSHLTNECESHGSFKRYVDSADVVANVLAGLVETVILDVDFAGLDASTIARIASHANLVGLCSDLAGESRLRQWGIESVVLLTPSELQQSARSVMGLALELQRSSMVSAADERGQDQIPLDISELTSEFSSGSSATSPEAARKIVVFGAIAGSGSTTVATGVAEALAARREATTLIDLDLDSPSIAENLALAEDASGLLRACRLAERGTLSTNELAQTARALGNSLRLLAGLPAPHRKPEVKPVALTRVLDVAAGLDRNLVVDLGAPWIPASPMVDGRELHYSLSAQDEVRTEVVEQLDPGDVLIAVVDCSPVAIAKATVLIGQVAKLAPEAQSVVVINRLRKSLLGTREAAEVSELIGQAVTDVIVTTVRFDVDTADKALLTGQTLREVNPKSSTVTDLSSMVDQLVQQFEFV